MRVVCDDGERERERRVMRGRELCFEGDMCDEGERCVMRERGV